MNIQELARQAIERINSMSEDELEAKFIEHGYGYKPVRRNEIKSFSCGLKEEILVPMERVEYSPIHEIEAANQPTFFTMENCNMDLAA